MLIRELIANLKGNKFVTIYCNGKVVAKCGDGLGERPETNCFLDLFALQETIGDRDVLTILPSEDGKGLDVTIE